MPESALIERDLLEIGLPRLRDANRVPRRVAERAVARPTLINRLLQYLAARGLCPLERRIHIVRGENEKRQHALSEQLLERVAVGLRPTGVRRRDRRWALLRRVR